ncbi:hypothetical protein E5288_WYG021871 [Bos mutus]|uniref:Uncharacterized protein n=1 Tax=Bos mutus TaxID=72004 RepID=A0A6B0SC63_9CETA|nr:hypothetical protein [Bos mutus]
MEGEPKEDRTVNGEDPSAEGVIFAHLNHRTLSERLLTPTPLSPMHLSAETSIYEEFDVNQIMLTRTWPHPLSTQSVIN